MSVFVRGQGVGYNDAHRKFSVCSWAPSGTSSAAIPAIFNTAQADAASSPFFGGILGIPLALTLMPIPLIKWGTYVTIISLLSNSTDCAARIVQHTL
jgi:hypothetical protein